MENEMREAAESFRDETKRKVCRKCMSAMFGLKPFALSGASWQWDRLIENSIAYFVAEQK